MIRTTTVGVACPGCGAPLHHRVPRSLARSAALGLSAIILLVPAYLLPVMSIAQFGREQADTIFSGVGKLWAHGQWGIALIVFTASLLVPLLKLLSLGLLLAVARWPGLVPAATLGRLHRLLHIIGPWSMLDIFLVAFLCGIVRFDGLATVVARPGALAFAAVVVLTMLATEAFDPRLLWDPVRPAPTSPPVPSVP